MAENYYQILDVDGKATQEQIKSAYRRKVKRLHPDRFQGGNAPFRAVQEAYEVLCDPVRRQRYDEELARAQRVRHETSGVDPLSWRRHPPAEPLVPTGRATGSRDAFFDAPFPFPLYEFLAHRRGVPYQPRVGPAEEIHVQLSLSPEQAQHGGRIRLLIPLEFACPTCGGWGDDGFFECRRCFGGGVLSGERPVDVAFPPRVADGSAVRVSLNRPRMPDLLVTLHFEVNRR
jgi:DnaJ-class molecular chaperone